MAQTPRAPRRKRPAPIATNGSAPPTPETTPETTEPTPVAEAIAAMAAQDQKSEDLCYVRMPRLVPRDAALQWAHYMAFRFATKIDVCNRKGQLIKSFDNRDITLVKPEGSMPPNWLWHPSWDARPWGRPGTASEPDPDTADPAPATAPKRKASQGPGPRKDDPNAKSSRLVALLSREGGATRAEMKEITEWAVPVTYIERLAKLRDKKMESLGDDRYRLV